MKPNEQKDDHYPKIQVFMTELKKISQLMVFWQDFLVSLL